jgi:uncharacterized membrane protein
MAIYTADSQLSTTDLLRLAQAGTLSAAALDAALILAGKRPDATGWWRWAARLCLCFGAAGVLFGVIFTVAYNWEEINALLGCWGKFATLELIIIGLTLAAYWRGLDTAVGRVALISSMVLVGPLLALFGQTYQTGADTFTLFLTWAFLVLPWALASRNASAWLLVIVLFETAMLAYFGSHGNNMFEFIFLAFWGVFSPWELVVLSNLGVLILWELATLYAQQGKGLGWLLVGWSRVSPQLLAWSAMAVLTVMCVIHIFSWGHEHWYKNNYVSFSTAWVVWLVCMVVGGWFYTAKRELSILSIGLLSLLAIVISFEARLLFHRPNHAWVLSSLVEAITLLGFGTATRVWFKHLTHTANTNNPVLTEDTGA